MGFDSLSLFLQNQIGGTKFQFKKNKLVIDSLNVIGTNDLGINISVKISGSKKGTIYVYGQPQFDPQLQELRLTNIQLTLSSNNLLLKTAKWLLDQKIEKTLEAKSVIKIEDQLIHDKKLISEKLNGEISDGIQLKTELRTMKLTSLKLSEKDLQLWLQFLGDASVNISTAP